MRLRNFVLCCFFLLMLLGGCRTLSSLRVWATAPPCPEGTPACSNHESGVYCSLDCCRCRGKEEESKRRERRYK